MRTIKTYYYVDKGASIKIYKIQGDEPVLLKEVKKTESDIELNLSNKIIVDDYFMSRKMNKYNDNIYIEL